jgi:IS1 family transposase
MNKLDTERQSLILSSLVEGLSIRSIERLTGVHRDTIMRLLVTSGEHAQTVLDEKLQNLDSRLIQIDEIWTYVGKKQKQLTPFEREHGTDNGDQYVFVAIDAETKLVPLHLIGKRTDESTQRFIDELSTRIRSKRLQVTTDGFGPYVNAMYYGFGDRVDFARLIKNYGEEIKAEKRYSPARLVGITIKTEIGEPDPKYISTSYVERQNLTMRMSMRRFTRLTNAFSKKLANLEAACALHFYHYNFMRSHRSLRCSPAMAAGIEKSFLDWSVLLD